MFSSKKFFFSRSSSRSSWSVVGNPILGFSNDDTVCLSGNGLVLANGSPGFDGRRGRVRVYVFSGGGWQRRGSDILGGAQGDEFGRSVSLSSDGSVLAAGAPHSDTPYTGGETITDGGGVRVYSWNGSDHVRKGSDLNVIMADEVATTPSGPAVGAYSGWCVVLSGDGGTIAIGEPSWDVSGDAYMSGRVRVYHWAGSSWVLRGRSLNEVFGGGFYGWSVGLNFDGTRLVVGAPGNSGTSGRSYSYHWENGDWVVKNSFTGLGGEGGSVAMSGDGLSLVTGGDQYSSGSYEGPGYFRSYYWNGSQWARRGSDMFNDGVGDRISVDISHNGLTLVSGHSGFDGFASSGGAVRIRDWDGSQWVLSGEFGGSQGEGVGRHVSMSDDGDTVAFYGNSGVKVYRRV